ncbi:host specificity protein J [Symbiopectobacterium purcellii]|uniref:host specificity protein J n=1 Tax=Symbiopectobacterium purcellii TaxID=2871826 RepID=UPI003F868F8B
MTIHGRKGGGGNARTPVESPDSIQSTSYAKILLALGEGEFSGGLDGSRVFLDGTPITDANGNANFSGVTWEFRSGTPDQSYIPGFPGVENEITVSTELTSQTAWVRSLTNTQLSAVRLRFSWSALQQQQDNGDVGGYRIEYAIDVATDGGSYQELLKTAVDGKTTTKYERSHRIDLPDATTGWQIRVRRITPNSTSNRIADKMVIDAVTEIIDAKLRYPETALLFVQFDAKQFQNIPVISCEPDGRIIRVPSNYDPVARTYSGAWNGTFKWTFTNNPAWVYYDIQISDRFGLGNRIKAENLSVSKWSLYQIAQYCDQLVPDGRGGNGTEPRFLCDVYIQSQEEAWTVLNDLAAIFRGATFWGNNQMNVIADMPRDIDYIVTRANVKDGKFTYSNASEKTHYSQAMVSWSDPANSYQDAVEAVNDNKLVKRYGIKQADVTAIGCIRQTEAIRRGKWILHTNDADRAIAYTMGLDGDIPVPGSIVGVADSLLAGRPLGGRISAVDGRNITLDRVSSAAIGERLIVNLPSGKAEGRTIEAVNDNIITVTTDYSETPIAESVWAIDATDLALQLYRIVGVAEADGGLSFDITGVEYDPDKWDKIDNGARIESRPISVIPPSVQPAPESVEIGSYNTVDQGINVTTLRVTWDRAESAIAYEAQWRRDNGNWINAARTSALGFEVPGIYAGQYQARVRAINAAEISSMWTNAQETRLNGKEGNPPALASFITVPLVFGIQLNWSFPADTDDTLKTEIHYSPTSDGQTALLLADVAYPTRTYQQMGLSVGQAFFYRARIVDKSGNQGPWTNWIRGGSSTDVSDITDVIVGEITETDAWKSLVGEVENNTLQISDGMLNSIEQAKAIIRNSLANDAETRRWRAQNGDRAAEITETRATIANEVEARTIAMLEMQSSIGATNSNLTQLQQTVATQNETTSQQLTNLNSQMNDPATGLTANATAVQGLQTSVTSIDGQLTAQATQLTQLTSTVNGVTTQISDISSIVNGTDAKLSAYRTLRIKVDANGRQYVAGMTQSIEDTDQGMQSNTIFLQDRFSIMNAAGGNPQLIFTTQGDQVIINSAIIGKGTITDLMIGDLIKSKNYSAGVSGWMINKDGTAEFNDMLFRGDLQSNNYAKDVRGWKISKNGDAEFHDGSFYGTVYAGKIVGDVYDYTYSFAGEYTGIIGLDGGNYSYQLFKIKRELFDKTIIMIGSTDERTRAFNPPIYRETNEIWFCNGQTGAGGYGGLYIDDDLVIDMWGRAKLAPYIRPRKIILTIPAGEGFSVVSIKMHRNPSSGGTMVHKVVFKFDVAAFRQSSSITPIMNWQ